VAIVSNGLKRKQRKKAINADSLSMQNDDFVVRVVTEPEMRFCAGEEREASCVNQACQVVVFQPL
jgi:hypothetical protein